MSNVLADRRRSCILCYIWVIPSTETAIIAPIPIHAATTTALPSIPPYPCLTLLSLLPLHTPTHRQHPLKYSTGTTTHNTTNPTPIPTKCSIYLYCYDCPILLYSFVLFCYISACVNYGLIIHLWVTYGRETGILLGKIARVRLCSAGKIGAGMNECRGSSGAGVIRGVETGIGRGWVRGGLSRAGLL